MTTEQLLLGAVLLGTLVLFLWGRWRHDVVAMAALLVCVALGLVPSAEAFSGFGHPAVITVACVLVLSFGLQTSGAVDALVRTVMPTGAGPTLTIAALTGLGALLSGFMNNVGALALLIPVAMQLASRMEVAPARVLMPLAFGTILGGMLTLVGTPPNLIVSGFRAEMGMGHFGMFDFTPVGLAVAALGVLFVAGVGWRLVPARKAAAEGFETEAYLTEVRVHEDSKLAGQCLREVDEKLKEHDAMVVGLVRHEVRMVAPHPGRRVHAGDILVIQADADALAAVLGALGLKLEEAVEPEQDGADKDEADVDAVATVTARRATTAPAAGLSEVADAEEEAAPEDEIGLVELVVLPQSSVIGRSASDIQMRTRYGINLLAISRQGRRTATRLRSTTLQAGDVLLMQGSPESVSEFAANAGCVPLAERALTIPDRRKALLATGIMGAAVAAATLGIPAALAFAGGALLSMVLRTVPVRQLYQSVDWPVVVLLAALIPVAGAMQATGLAELIARFMLETLAQGHVVGALVLVLVVTMLLSDLMNNAATAAVMCPVAIGIAAQLGVNVDTFLMAVAVGASCAFLTPIGHQNNTLILGPGGLRFGDYWRLGLPLEVVVLAVGVPMLLWVWPL
ncbi:SLC13 family permease [Thioalkalivibrio denitrificans]|uniref:SLC13 family permease n=1 Tax=Thioalkalivibrio denitrificans TaxID=108003 RepID=A0A1V3NF80_9GAMM|nr:SLC13 family permease [Thioalkalivibrio denitrificans]OOG23769.1 SLC13 family permease [Thioalkalivibrio denitrificans]